MFLKLLGRTNHTKQERLRCRYNSRSAIIPQWRIQGRGRGFGLLPLNFRPNWGPKGQKKNFGECFSPYLRVWMTALPLLSQGLDSVLSPNMPTSRRTTIKLNESSQCRWYNSKTLELFVSATHWISWTMNCLPTVYQHIVQKNHSDTLNIRKTWKYQNSKTNDWKQRLHNIIDHHKFLSASESAVGFRG